MLSSFSMLTGSQPGFIRRPRRKSMQCFALFKKNPCLARLPLVSQLLELLDLFNASLSTPEERSDRSRCMAVARTNLETTIMWAVKGVTSASVNTAPDLKP